MRIVNKRLRLFLLLIASWLVFTLDLNLVNIVIGIMMSSIITIVAFKTVYDREGTPFYIMEFTTFIRFILRLFYEIYKSSFIHILRIIKKDENPIIFEVELSVKNPYIISIISNAITLTPGTITVDIIGNKLYVLAIKGYGEDPQALKEEIKRKFEAPFIHGGEI